MRFSLFPICAVFFFASNINSASADWLDDVGWRSLLLQEEGVVENGAGIHVSQVEAPTGSGAYLPDENHNQFAGKKFIDASGTHSGISTHATNMGRVFYGNAAGMGRGVTLITIYDANHWINTVLGFVNGRDPGAQPFQVQNHSWISTGNGPSISTEVLRRFDFIPNRDNISFIVGSSNGNGSVPELLAHGYNLISVGRTDGSHGHGATQFYGAGRTKPEIVAPRSTTSSSTAVISSAAALLREAGGGKNGVETNATQNEMVKAFLLAGATKEEFPDWDRTTTRPIDEVFGAGELNIQHSYNILQGGEFDGLPSSPGVPTELLGWDYSESISSEKFYAFDVANGAKDVSIMLTWNIDVVDLAPTDPNSFVGQATLADMNLEFFDSSGKLIDSSFSTVDNVEHIYIAELPPGQYSLRVESDTDFDYALAWRMTANPDPIVVLPDSFIASGFVISGGLAEILESDNQKLVVASGSSSQTVDFKGLAPTEMPTQFFFTIETSVRSALPVEQKLYLFNYDDDDYELVDTRPARVLGDQVVVIYPGGQLSRFVQPGTRCVESRIEFTKSGLSRGIQAFIDQAVWTIN